MIPMNSQKSIFINMGIFAAIFLAYGAISYFTSQPEPKMLSYETEGLNAQLQPLNGTEKAVLKDFRGQNVLLHFWTSSCQPCKAEWDLLEQIAQRYHNSEIKFVGIASADTREELHKSGILTNSSFTQYLDESGNLARALGVKTLPQTMLVDYQGRVVSHFNKAVDQKLDAVIETFLKNKKKNTSPSSLPEFAFENSLGGQVTNRTLNHKLWVANFIFTSCPGQCPTMTAKMRALQERFKRNERLKLVSISVDPETDTPQILRSYQKKHGADPSQWYFLTGPILNVKRLLTEGFKLGSPDDPDYHTNRFILVDGLRGSRQNILGYYDSDSPESLAKLEADIASLLE